MKKFILLFLLYSSFLNALEFKTNILTSFSSNGESDLIFNSHNTLLLGGTLKVGGYYGHEVLHSYVTDTTVGGALRIGNNRFIELQGGAFTRKFTDHTNLTGKGFAFNILYGARLSEIFSITLLMSAKKINSGMDPRWIYKILPYLGVQFGY